MPQIQFFKVSKSRIYISFPTDDLKATLTPLNVSLIPMISDITTSFSLRNMDQNDTSLKKRP